MPSGSTASFPAPLESCLPGPATRLLPTVEVSGTWLAGLRCPAILCQSRSFYSRCHFSSFFCYPLLSQGADPTGYVTQVPRWILSRFSNWEGWQEVRGCRWHYWQPWGMVYGSSPSRMGAPWSLTLCYLPPVSLHPRASLHPYFAHF